jgi:hypothetical protein
MLTPWAVLPLLFAVTDPHLTLVYAVHADACVTTDMLVEELHPRLSDMTFLDADLADDAIGYKVGLAARPSIAPSSPTLVAVELQDPLGSPLLAQTLECGDDPRLVARQCAVLIEGHIRLHMQRFGKLLAVIRDSDERNRPPATAVIAEPGLRPAEPIAWVGATLNGLADSKSRRPTVAGAVSAELTLMPWLAPRVGVTAALPVSQRRLPYTFAVQETALDVGCRAWIWPGKPAAFIEVGYVLYLVSSRATSANANDQSVLDTYSGVHLMAGARYLLTGRWALVAGARADLLPRYPTLLWRGEPVVARGPWRAAIEAGAQVGF